MHEYMVTIGRNVGTEPMPRDTWAAFIRDVRSTLEWAQLTRSVTAEVEERHGRTIWDGQHEDSVRLNFRTESELYPETVAQIRTELRDYCERYGQEAIALCIGHSELIEPRQYVSMTGRW